MGMLDLFRYEEQEGKRYLIYEKREEDVLDTFTMEMLSNNKIEGLAPFSCIRMDRDVKMKYNITGLITLQELFSSPIRKQKFLGILESLAENMLRAEEYMLDVSSYILDESFIYTDPKGVKVFMIVLPIRRDGEKAEEFLKRLLFDVTYDQTEDCSYVASLMNFLGNENSFSMKDFRDQIIRFRKNPAAEQSRNQIRKGSSDDQMPNRPERLKKEEVGEKPAPFSDWKIPLPPNIEPHDKQKKSAAIEHGSHTQEKQRNLDIVFSDLEEEPKKKKGFFSKKEKSEKKEKKRFFGKKKEKDSDSDGNDRIPEKPPLGGIAIPGMDLIGKLQAERKENEELNGQISGQRQPLPIPAQHVDMDRREVEQEDFGETVYMDEDSEAPTEFEEEKAPRQKFVLYRCSTQETFEIKGDVVRVGRSPSISEICISGNRGVGRVHAVLYVREGQVYIVDNNSKNKTFVDGEELKPDQPVMLLSGSKIRLGTEELEFRISR